jgi:hypothetical protein
MKRQNVVLMLFLAVLLVAGTADSARSGNARQTVVLECGGVNVEPMPAPPGFNLSLEVIAVSLTSGAPEIITGEQCADAIGKLVNNRFRLLSATTTPSGFGERFSTVQYLFVSKPGRGDHENDD